MPQTAAQRRAAAAARMRQARGEGPVAVMEPEEPAVPERSEFQKGIDRALAVLANVEAGVRDQQEAEDAMKLLQEQLGKLSPEGFRAFTGQPEFQELIANVSVASGDKPGTPIFDVNGRQIGNVPYSYEDAKGIFPMHTWIPMRTNGCISWNGVNISVYEGVEVTTPKIFYDIEMESIKVSREAISGQLAVLQHPGRPAPADGVSIDTGWYKRSNEELERAEGVER